MTNKNEVFEKIKKFAAGGGNPHQFIELYGGEIVECYFHEPDPQTYREDYYYNSRLNRLFKKVQTETVPYWKGISEI